MGARLIVFVKDINLPPEDPEATQINPQRWQPGYVVDVFPENHPMGKVDWSNDRFKIVDTDMTFAEAQGFLLAPDNPDGVEGIKRREFKLDIKQIADSEIKLDEPVTVTKETLRSAREAETMVK